MKKAAARFGVGAMALVVAVPALCAAQMAPAPAAMSRVTVTQVKPDMLNEWRDLQKNEVVPGLKKAGVKTRTVYSSGLFGTAGEYTIITPIEKYADFDAGNPLIKSLGAEGAARLGEKLRKCTVGSHSYAITRLADLSNATTPPPPMIVSTRLRVAPGRLPDFQNLIKTEVLPIYKAAKISLTVNSRGLGGNPTDVTLSSGLNKYAELDAGSPLLQKLGPEGVAKLLAKFTGISTVIEQIVRARVADLSF
jgi:hypothetical protein